MRKRGQEYGKLEKIERTRINLYSSMRKRGQEHGNVEKIERTRKI